jgi:arylsulfatase
MNGDGTLDNSLLIITSDHGDAFGEHGYYEHPRYLHDELVHVPLIVAHPDLDPQTVETAVSTTDIAATISELLDEGTHGVGESLFGLPDTSDDRTVFQQARGEGEDSEIRRFAARTSRESAFAEYDSNSETTSVATADSDEIRDALLAYVADRAGKAHSDDSEETVANEEIEQRLSALGYK